MDTRHITKLYHVMAQSPTIFLWAGKKCSRIFHEDHRKPESSWRSSRSSWKPALPKTTTMLRDGSHGSTCNCERGDFKWNWLVESNWIPQPKWDDVCEWTDPELDEAWERSVRTPQGTTHPSILYVLVETLSRGISDDVSHSQWLFETESECPRRKISSFIIYGICNGEAKPVGWTIYLLEIKKTFNPVFPECLKYETCGSFPNCLFLE